MSHLSFLCCYAAPVLTVAHKQPEPTFPPIAEACFKALDSPDGTLIVFCTRCRVFSRATLALAQRSACPVCFSTTRRSRARCLASWSNSIGTHAALLCDVCDFQPAIEPHACVVRRFVPPSILSFDCGSFRRARVADRPRHAPAHTLCLTRHHCDYGAAAKHRRCSLVRRCSSLCCSSAGSHVSSLQCFRVSAGERTQRRD